MKKVLLSILFVALAVVLASCVVNPDPVPTPEPQKELENFVIVLPDGSEVRNYNEIFDEMINDYSTASSATVSSHLRVAVSDKLENPASSPDAAIYKMATGTYPIETYDAIGFRMRTLGEGKLDLSNLVLGLRGDDAYDVFPISLADAVDIDGDELPELSDEYQEFVICPNLSIEDDQTEYQLVTGGASGVKVLDKILGFHLYLTGECAQILEIEQVYLVKGADITVLDSFNRERIAEVDTNVCWWRDSRGFIVQQGVDASAKDGVTFAYEGDKENIILKVMGDTTDATLNGIKWTELKDSQGNNLPNAVDGAFFPLVINLANSGLTKGSFTLKSSKELVLSEVFASNLETKEIVTVYPEIDAENINMFDNFNRTQFGFDGDYEKSSTNPIVIEAGLNYALSYNNGDKVSIADGHLTFDATTAVNYINFKEGKTIYQGEQFLVILAKAEDGANLNDFRFDVGNGVTYANQMYSAFGLHIPLLNGNEAGYPYVDKNGYTWLIIDLAESNMVPNASDGFIDMYYSGTGKLLIDAIFYADLPEPDYIETKIATINGVVKDNYEYLQGFSSDGINLVKFKFTAEEGVTLGTLRLNADGGDAAWFKDGAIKDAKGNAIDSTLELDGLEIIVDLTASGLGLGWNHLHSGDMPGAALGTFTLEVFTLELPEPDYVETKITTINGVVKDNYEYLQGFSSDGINLVKFKFTAEEGVTLGTLRLNADGGDAAWFKDGAIKDAKGNAIDSTLELDGLEIIVDLTASGLGLGWNHLHSGDMPGAALGTFTLDVFTLELATHYEKIMDSLVQ